MTQEDINEILDNSCPEWLAKQQDKISILDDYWRCVVDNQELFESEFLSCWEQPNVRVNDIHWNGRTMIVEWVWFESANSFMDQHSRFSIQLWNEFYNRNK